jgi:hypothetical protein
MAILLFLAQLLAPAVDMVALLQLQVMPVVQAVVVVRVQVVRVR